MRLDTDFLLTLAIPAWGCAIGVLALRRHDYKRAWGTLPLGALMLVLILAVRLLKLDDVAPVYALPSAGAADDSADASGAAAASPNSLAAALLDAANKITRTAPHMVDDNTRLDGAFAGPDKAFTYLFTLPNLSPQQVRPGYFARAIAPAIKKNACASSQLKFFFDNNVPVTYKYRSLNGTELGSVLISRSACRPKPVKPETSSAPLGDASAPVGDQDNTGSSSADTGPLHDATGAAPN